MIKQNVDNLMKMGHLDKNDGKRIWKQFQRFCEYSDLKDLYNRVIPELQKFEQKII